MENLLANAWLVAAIGFVAGVLLGALVTAFILRREDSGKTVAALREEFDDYREGVNRHFEKTSDLFQDLTEKYRDVYNHLADGAQTLAKDVDEAPKLEIIRPESLPDVDASVSAEPVLDAVQQPADNPVTAEQPR